MSEQVLAINAGSTSVKVSLFIDGADADGPADLDAALAGPAPRAVLHRVVHGGDRNHAVRLDDQIVDELDRLTDVAPQHQPPALDAIRRARAAWPDAAHVACFDTTFHRTLPTAARTYALPLRLREQVRVFGFHGLSHAWSARMVSNAFPTARRVLVAHLGGGQSLCGVLDGRSVVTTMGFTPADGLVMATRSGAVDPGAVSWLARTTDEDLDVVLETESGLLGLAGTADMRAVVEGAGDGDDRCRLALDVWTHRFVREAGGCIAALGGLDVLVFTGGIGEGSREIRRRVADRLSWLGVAVAHDEPASTAEPVDITASEAAVHCVVVHAREDRQMLADAHRLLPRDPCKPNVRAGRSSRSS